MQKSSFPLSATFDRFFESEKSGGLVLLGCTFIAILLANSFLGAAYLDFWQVKVAGLTFELWVNDGLMAIFFLLIGLELERELYVGELSEFRNSLLPVIAAAGGMAVPALIHYAFNHGLPSQAGIGIPMATDIAFALGALAILGSRVPVSLKIFVAAFAVIDDLGAIVLIATFYTAELALEFLIGAMLVWSVLMMMNRVFRIMALWPYLVGGGLMWFLMLKSGVHATMAGVMLAFAIPFNSSAEDQASPSHRLEHMLERPVAFLILPVFALANTGIVYAAGWMDRLVSENSLGIMLGLTVGKPVGVTLFCGLAVMAGLCRLPGDLRWSHLVGAGLLGGIGFTMSIFITNLAFIGDPVTINASKFAIVVASLLAGVTGYLWLRWVPARETASVRRQIV